MTDITPADEKDLAFYYAYAALVRTLCKNGTLKLDHLMVQLDGATKQLLKIGETGAGEHLASMVQSLQGVDE